MSNFIGSYSKTIVEVLTASVLANQNAMLVGLPGWGKTDISDQLARHYAGDDYCLLEIEPSTPPDVAKGAYNPASLLNGRLERVLTGTPYAPGTKITILDEIGRANEVLYDALLHVTNRRDAGRHPVWGTANYMPNNERTAALVDRFPLWVHLKQERLDMGALVKAHMNGDGRPQIDPAGVPTWQEIEQVRSFAPGHNAIAAIDNLLSELQQEVEAANLTVHPRRGQAWMWLLYRVSAWKTGTADFNSVPDYAKKFLRYAWPCLTADEQDTWATIAGSVVDRVGSAIEETLAEVGTELKKLINEKDAMKRAAIIQNFGMMMSNAQTTLKAVSKGDDQRIDKAILTMNNWLSLAVQGKPIE